MSALDAVVAWHMEDIEWVKHIQAMGFNIRLYQKGGLPIDHLPKTWEVTRLPNVGREAQTYLYHIVTHYQSLADRTLFTQGEHRDQAPHLLHLLRALDNRPSKYQEFAAFTLHFRSTDESQGVPMRDAFRTFFGREIPNEDWTCQACAFFVVSRDRILRHPRACYERAMHWLEETSVGDQMSRFGAVGGLALERMWHQIFDPRVPAAEPLPEGGACAIPGI